MECEKIMELFHSELVTVNAGPQCCRVLRRWNGGRYRTKVQAD
ncbi:MAG: hypothetical protein ACLVEX_07250 [Ruthenibacterium lactatiformans]